jgi:UDP-glucose 4-epimerase
VRVLVTGGSGYLGSRIAAGFDDDPTVEEVVNLDLRPPRRALPKARFVQRSVTDDLGDALSGVDLVIHAAWVLDPMRNARRQREICIGGTRNVLAACGAARVPHLVFVSSDTVYGARPESQGPHDEREPPRPGFPYQYADEKREAETLVKRFADEHPSTLVQSVRPATVWGAGVTNYIARTVARPIVWRPLGCNPALQLLHEDDVAPALLAIVRSGRPGPFNVGAEDTLPLMEVLRIVGARSVPVPLPLLAALADVSFRLGLRWLGEAPAGFVHYFAYNPILAITRLRDEAGFRPRRTTRDAITEWAAARRVIPRKRHDPTTGPLR